MQNEKRAWIHEIMNKTLLNATLTSLKIIYKKLSWIQRKIVLVGSADYFILLLVDSSCTQYDPMIQQDLFTARSMTFRHLTPRLVVCRGHCQLLRCFSLPNLSKGHLD